MSSNSFPDASIKEATMRRKLENAMSIGDWIDRKASKVLAKKLCARIKVKDHAYHVLSIRFSKIKTKVKFFAVFVLFLCFFHHFK